MLIFHSFVQSAKFFLQLTVNNVDKCLKRQSTTRYQESQASIGHYCYFLSICFLIFTTTYLGWHGCISFLEHLHEQLAQ